ncbi:MAG: competence/damage-inducible protein A [Armatimonadota bacterium]
MHLETISVGTELLLGQIVDTNAAWLSARLAEIGVAVYRRTTVGDNCERLVSALREALQRAPGVITIGGLGPTEDDLTREAIAEVLGEPLVLDEALAEQIRRLFGVRGRKPTAQQMRQAMRPPSARPIPNPNGTAPGLHVEKEGQFIIALPGPPNEFQPMVQEYVLPTLASRAGGQVIRSRVLRMVGIGEADAESALADLIQSKNPTLAPLAKLGEVHFRITVRAPSAPDAELQIAQMERTIRERLGRFIYGTDETTLEEVVVNLLRERGESLTVAESCTGGLLSKRITNVPGSSEAFLGGIVAYSNTVKQRLVGVPASILETVGAVSEPTARALAEGARQIIGSYWGIGITGIAGPGSATPEKPVGLVYIGLSNPHETAVYSQIFLGDRATVRWRATQFALWQLYDRVRQV